MNRLRALLLLSLLSFFGVDGAVPCSVSGPSALAIAQGSLGSVSVALLALIVSFNVIAIGYIIGKIIPGTKISEWVRSEFWEVAKSGMLIAGIYGVIILIGNVSTTLSGVAITPGQNGLSTLVNSACAYLSSEQVNIGNSLNYLFGLSGSLGMLRNAIVGAYFPYPPLPLPIPLVEFGFTAAIYKNGMLSPAGGPSWVSMLSDMINLIAVPVALLIAIQLNILPLLFALGIAMLIPIGIVFRSFPFVRAIGGALVAIGIGVALIYPSVLVLFNWPITSALQMSGLIGSGGSCSGNWFICGLLGVLTTLESGLTSAGTGVASLTSIYPALNGILYWGSYLILQFVLFILDLAITYSLSENIANALGGTIRLELGGKLSLR